MFTSVARRSRSITIIASTTVVCAEIQSHLRREILRAVRTEADIQAAQSGLALDGGVDEALLAQRAERRQRNRGSADGDSSLFALLPDSLSLKLKLLALLEEAKRGKRAVCDRSASAVCRSEPAD